MEEDEANAVAREGVRRIGEILDSVPNLHNGMTLPPEAQAEIDAVFAEARALGVLDGGA